MDTPDGLGPAGARFWADICAVFELNSAELALLDRAARTIDTLAGIDSWLADPGVLVVEGSMGQPRANPLLASKSEQERTLAALITALNLPAEDDRAGAQEAWKARRRSGAVG